MCRLASFIFKPTEDLPVRVACPKPHGDTVKALGLTESAARADQWRDGHYLPNGEIVCNVLAGDTLTAAQCESGIRARWPTFIEFFNWLLIEAKLTEEYSGSLYLSGLTSAKGLVLPKSIGGWLDLRGLTSAKGLVLPKSIGGSLYLNGLTSAKGLVLPKSIGGSLDLRGLTSAKGLVLPKSIGGSLDLAGLTPAERAAVLVTAGRE